jgi:cryptochrome
MAPRPTSNPTPPSAGPRIIYWHRTDLRLHDSPALHAALSLSPSVLIPLWTWDPHYVFRVPVGANRWRFLLDCQADLSSNYTALNPKQKLQVVRGNPTVILPILWKKWQITHLVFEADSDAYARERDTSVRKLAEAAGVKVVMKQGRTLFDPDELVRLNKGPTMSITQVQKAAAKIKGGIPRPLEAPSWLPDPLAGEGMDLSDVEAEYQRPEIEPDVNSVVRTLGDGHAQYTSLMGPQGNFSIPTLQELGIDPEDAPTPHRGGESVALALLASHCADEEYIARFEKPKTAPTAADPAATLLLSPHHHFGSLSIRRTWWDVQDVLERRRKEGKKGDSTTPENLEGQLLFRDMYFGAQASLGSAFARTVGNKVARFVDWHLQSNIEGSGRDIGSDSPGEGYTVDSPEAEEWFLRWKTGMTGFPWIDALMRQLRQEGWIHHLGRHAVACFLTRGGCYVHWERGAEVFEELLIDHETACNVGNWMWLSCTAFYSMYYRCYSPVAFPKKWDDNGDFVRRYCPELKNFDKKYIYEPHTAPVADQKRWKCLIRGDGSATKDDGMKVYPKPMFDFNERRQICMDKIKNAYGVGLYGADEKIMNGEWKKIFGYGDENGGVKEKETKGLVDRGKKRKEPKFEGEDDEQGESKTNEAKKSDRKSAAPARSSGKKQTSLDAHVGRKKAKA